ncbi:MAG: hypothetical protein DYH18_01175 [Xanthomonadales bacterium PRO7]|jgi:uncharacterized membrane protein YkoI|nr:hypothetical protein [Xanthomonadales bacterium PRO7]HMM57226.1 hypothetical protein [Rudaea sp.]
MDRRAALVAIAALVVAVPAWAEKTITLQQAIDKVERDTHGKVLSAETKHFGRHTIYRIKVLTRDGQVRVIEVPAEQSGS